MGTEKDRSLPIQCPMPEILKLLGAGRRGEAINLYSQISGCSLKMAGAAVRRIEVEDLASHLKVEDAIHKIVQLLVERIDDRIQQLRDFKLHIQYAAIPREGDE